MGYDQTIFRKRNGHKEEVTWCGNNWIIYALLFGHSLHDDGYFTYNKVGIRKMRKALENAKYLSAITNQGSTLDWLNFSAICPITDEYERNYLTVTGNADELTIVEFDDGTREFIDVLTTIGMLETVINTHKPGDTYTYAVS